MNLKNWVEENNVLFKKENIRPWGTYDLVVSVDNGQTWAMMNRPFGSRITETEAFEMVLTDNLSNDTFKAELEKWIGTERSLSLFNLLNNVHIDEQKLIT